jgi:hypothetical protein
VDKYILEAVSNEETPLFYGAKPERAQKTGCVGYMRLDFGKKGDEFWHTWFDQCGELNTQAFKDDFKNVIETLRESVLTNLSSMATYCYNNPQAKLHTGRESTYGFKVQTDSHVYYLRCFTQKGDYNLYCFAYERGRLEKCFQALKPSLMDKVEAGKQKSARQEQPDKPKIKKTEALE